jgi:Fe-S cluster biogenesis protein NfuA
MGVQEAAALQRVKQLLRRLCGDALDAIREEARPQRLRVGGQQHKVHTLQQNGTAVLEAGCSGCIVASLASNTVRVC